MANSFVDLTTPIINTAGLALAGGTANSNVPAITGTADAGLVLMIYDGIRLIGTTTVNPDGTWSLTPTAALKAGAHKLVAISMDTLDHNSPASASFAVTIPSVVSGVHHAADEGSDSSEAALASLNADIPVQMLMKAQAAVQAVSAVLIDAPAAPVLLGLSDLSKGEIADVAPGGISHDANTTVVFSANAGDVVKFYDNGSLIGSVVAHDGFNGWKLPTLADGVHNISLTDTNGAGATSTPLEVSFTVATAPVLLGLSDFSTGEITNFAPGGISHDANPAIVFTAIAGDIVSLYDNGVLIGSMVAKDGVNGWKLPTLANGVHNLSLTDTNGAGITGTPLEVSFTVAASTVAAASAVTGSVPVISSAEDMGALTYVISGTGHPGDSVRLFDGVVSIGFGLVDSTGHWSITPSDQLDYGTHALTATAYGNGVFSAASAAFELSVGNVDPAPQPALFDLPAPELHIVDLSGDPAAYFHQASAHLQGGADGVNALHLSGEHIVLDLTALTGQTAAAKVSGFQVMDLGGHDNTLKLSLVDVLNLGEQNLFQYDDTKQMMIKGAAGDTVDLSAGHVAQVMDGMWEHEGVTQVGGVVYNVYEHANASAELLVQQGVNVVLH